ncbi:MAG: FIG01124115: hypothetical protein, partial [uncultured Blastococcus sp.]
GRVGADADHRAGVVRGDDRGRRARAGAARPRRRPRPGDRTAGVAAAQPRLRRPGLPRPLPAAPVTGLGHRGAGAGPRVRGGHLLRPAGGGARLGHRPADRGRAGGPAQRFPRGLPAVGAAGHGADGGAGGPRPVPARLPLRAGHAGPRRRRVRRRGGRARGRGHATRRRGSLHRSRRRLARGHLGGRAGRAAAADRDRVRRAPVDTGRRLGRRPGGLVRRRRDPARQL